MNEIFQSTKIDLNLCNQEKFYTSWRKLVSSLHVSCELENLIKTSAEFEIFSNKLATQHKIYLHNVHIIDFFFIRSLIFQRFTSRRRHQIVSNVFNSTTTVASSWKIWTSDNKFQIPHNQDSFLFEIYADVNQIQIDSM